MSNIFIKKRDDLLKLLDSELTEARKEEITTEIQFGFPQNKENKGIGQYCYLLEKIISYIQKNTKDGFFQPLEGDTIIKLVNSIRKQANSIIGSDEWEKYIVIFIHPTTKQFSMKTTRLGSKVWKSKCESISEKQEKEKCDFYWNQMKILTYEFNKKFFNKQPIEEPKQEEKKEEKGESWITIIK